MIKLPHSIFWNYKNIISITNKLREKLGYEPDIEDVAKEINMSVDMIKKYRLLDYNIVGFDSISDYSVDIEDMIDTSGIMNDNLRSKFEYIFKRLDLSDREIEIIKLRFGFYDKVYSLREIGEKYNIKHQRVNQIVNRIIEKIKLTKCAEELAEFTNNYKNCMVNIEKYRNDNKRKKKVILK